MAKKNRQQQQRQKPEEPLADNWTTPFQDLKITFEEPPPPKPVQQDPPKKERTKEELELLAAFGADDPDSRTNRSDEAKGPQFHHKEEKDGRKKPSRSSDQALGLHKWNLLDKSKSLGQVTSWTEYGNLQGDIGQRARDG